MTKKQLFEQIKKKGSFLCVGLDTDIDKIPPFLMKYSDPLLEFNKAIIKATAEYAVAYKLNTAFYEAMGYRGWLQLQNTIAHIKINYPDILVIADAKRGDIGNTSSQYAKAFFETLNADAVTVAPYMGEDSVAPFLQFPGKWAIILALTSNDGAKNFQMKKNSAGYPMYLDVLVESQQWGDTDNIMYVIGATKAEHLKVIREFAPNHFLLIPGVGAQGGSLQEVAKYGINDQCGLLVNNSRGIIYASDGEDFAEIAGQKAAEMQRQMSQILVDLVCGP